MDTTGTIKMMKALESVGAGVALSKFLDVKDIGERSFFTIGLKDYDRLKQYSHTCPRICIDVANGYTQYFVEYVKKIRKDYPKSLLMVGNVATPEMVQELLLAGADIIKIGIGPGSACETRRITGVGYPQLSAIIECADAAHGLNGLICADGGMSEPGYVCKAFAAGADFVMLGGLFAGCPECEGERRLNYETAEEFNYYGMSSKKAIDKYSDGLQDYRASEGKDLWIPVKPPAIDCLREITGGLRSACTYVGASSLKDFPKCASFV
jgi:GMP reductase